MFYKKNKYNNNNKVVISLEYLIISIYPLCIICPVVISLIMTSSNILKPLGYVMKKYSQDKNTHPNFNKRIVFKRPERNCKSNIGMCCDIAIHWGNRKFIGNQRLPPKSKTDTHINILFYTLSIKVPYVGTANLPVLPSSEVSLIQQHYFQYFDTPYAHATKLKRFLTETQAHTRGTAAQSN